MRYDDWDVILFPKDSHVPIQEFKTACYVAPDEYGRQLPVLTCYISSLPPATPFRISVHSWATAPRPSAIIEAKRKASQKAVYTVRVVVDGTAVFRSFFDIASKWPQEIVYEKRSLSSVGQPTSQERRSLAFPLFHLPTLAQTSWDARDPTGRIRIFLSEQLVSKTSSPGEVDLGAANEIVCFSFQHAPKDVLEQAGIAWPIRNPLYLPHVHDQATRAFQTSPTFEVPNVPAHPLSQLSKSALTRSSTAEPHQRPQSHLPIMTHVQKPIAGARGHRQPGVWDNSMAAFGYDADDIGMESWAARRTTSDSMGDLMMPESMYMSANSFQQEPMWANRREHEQSINAGWTNVNRKNEKDKQATMILRNEQEINGVSPRKHRGLQHSFGTQQEPLDRPPTAHIYFAPKVGHAAPTVRPSSVAMARTSLYSEFDGTQRSMSSKGRMSKFSYEMSRNNSNLTRHTSNSSNKENRPPQSRLPTPRPQTSQIMSPDPFVQRIPVFDPNVSMKEPTSTFSRSRTDRDREASTAGVGKAGSAHAPSITGTMKGRKEGASDTSSNLVGQRITHDHDIFPTDGDHVASHQSGRHLGRRTNRTTNAIPSLVEIIDVDAIDPELEPEVSQDTSKLSPYKSSHKSGMSSIDSTVRFEQNLMSALGDELAGFEHDADTISMAQQLAHPGEGTLARSDLSGGAMFDPPASDFEPAIKRKRQGTLGGERDRSPLSKKEKAGQVVGGDGEDVERD